MHFKLTFLTLFWSFNLQWSLDQSHRVFSFLLKTETQCCFCFVFFSISHKILCLWIRAKKTTAMIDCTNKTGLRADQHIINMCNDSGKPALSGRQEIPHEHNWSSEDNAAKLDMTLDVISTGFIFIYLYYVTSTSSQNTLACFFFYSTIFLIKSLTHLIDVIIRRTLLLDFFQRLFNRARPSQCSLVEESSWLWLCRTKVPAAVNSQTINVTHQNNNLARNTMQYFKKNVP